MARATDLRYWAKADDEILLLMHEQGSSVESIALVVERPWRNVEKRLNELLTALPPATGPGAKAKPVKPAKVCRQCLCCQKTFLSDGPHHRMCNPCRKAAPANTNRFTPN